MDNEAGILRTLLIILEHQLALQNRLMEIEAHHKALAENVLDEFPVQLRRDCEERYKSLLDQAKSDNDLAPYAVHRAVAEIQNLLSRKY